MSLGFQITDYGPVFTRYGFLAIIRIEEAGASKDRVPKVDLGNQR